MGVHKAFHTQDGERKRILRIIANFTPTNALQRHHKGAASTMGHPGLWPHMVLLKDEIFPVYSDDQVACFHCYVVPRVWRGAFVINKLASGWAWGDPGGPRRRPRFVIVPMGWLQAVAVSQEAA